MKIKKIMIKKNVFSKISMLAWLIIPIGIIIIATNYLFNSNNTTNVDLNSNSEMSIPSSEISTSAIKEKFNTFKWNRKGVVSILFVGARKSHFELAYPVISQKGLSAAISVPTQAIGKPGYTTWLQLKQLQYKGWEIASQSRSEICDIKLLEDPLNLEKEIYGSLKDLTTVGLIVNTYVPPCGQTSPVIQKKVKENYKAMINYGININSVQVKNSYGLVARLVGRDTSIDEVKSWISLASRQKGWLIIAFGDIDNTIDDKYSTNEKSFNDVIDAVLASGLQIALPSQIINQQI